MRRLARLLPWAVLSSGLLGIAPRLDGAVPPSGERRELESAPFLFVVWGDTKLGVEVLSRLSERAVRLNPAFNLYTGDLVARGFRQRGMERWKKAMDGILSGDTAPNGMSETVFAVRGNHDRSNTSGWQAYFDFQATAQRIGATHYTDAPGEVDLSYSFDYGTVHLIGVDVPGDASEITSDQIRWIDADLSGAEDRGLIHAFLFFHGPIYCVGPHCSCGGRICSIDASVQDLIGILNKHRIVSATFHGHEHTNAYTYIDETRVPAEGAFRGVTHPFHQFITGSAGAGTATCGASRCDYEMREPGFAAVSLDGPKVAVSFYPRGRKDPVKTIRFTAQGVATS